MPCCWILTDQCLTWKRWPLYVKVFRNKRSHQYFGCILEQERAIFNERQEVVLGRFLTIYCSYHSKKCLANSKCKVGLSSNRIAPGLFCFPMGSNLGFTTNRRPNYGQTKLQNSPTGEFHPAISKITRHHSWIGC